MPLKVRRYSTSFFLILALAVTLSYSQTPPEPTASKTQDALPTTTPVRTPTSAEIMRERIVKAKAFIAVRNYNAAIYELENIRRETSDHAVRSVSNVLLMNSYLEQGDYKRAKSLLDESFISQKTGTPGSVDTFNAVAAQVVKSARSKAERYRGLGLIMTDRTLPLEVLNDLEKMREMVEAVISHAKENGKDQSKADSSLALLEEGTAVRSVLGRDDYDVRRWTDEAADFREQIAISRSVITNAVDGTTSPLTPNNETVQNTSATRSPPSQTGGPTSGTQLVRPASSDQLETPVLVAERSPDTERPKAEPKAEPIRPIIVQSAPREDPSATQTTRSNVPVPEKATGPLHVGSLLSFATRQTAPIYPPAARSTRTTGVVRVEVMVDENGEVVEIQRTSGPSMLQSAAKDAVLKWRFRPFVRDGQPVRATGFISFNFSL